MRVKSEKRKMGRSGSVVNRNVEERVLRSRGIVVQQEVFGE